MHQCRPPMQRERCLKGRNRSIFLAASTPPHPPNLLSQSRQTCCFVLGFIPLMGEPGCPQSGLEHARCSQGHGCFDSLASSDLLPGQGSSPGQSGGRCFRMPMAAWPGLDSRTLSHLIVSTVFSHVFFFFPKPAAALLTHPYITLGAAYVAPLFLSPVEQLR